MAVPDQENGCGTSRHQAFQKAAHHARIQATFFKHEPHAAPPVDGAEHIQPIPRARTAHHRGLPPSSPGRPRMGLATQPRFVSKPDFGFQALGLFGNGRVFPNPPPNFVRPPHTPYKIFFDQSVHFGDIKKVSSLPILYGSTHAASPRACFWVHRSLRVLWSCSRCL